MTVTTVPELDIVERQFIKAITKPRERDQQTKLGPSGVGSCPYCVGFTMAAKLCEMPDREAGTFGYAAWVGTGVHYFLEHNLDLAYGAGYDIETLRETKLENIFEIPGYGQIGGSCDLFVPDWGRTFDFKLPGKWSYDKVQTAIAKARFAISKGNEVKPEHAPSMQYRVQQQVYAQGWIQRGYKVCNSVIIFLPRHSNDIRDVIFWEEPVDQNFFDRAVARAISIWDYTQDGQLVDLPSDEGCYTCNTYGRGNLTNYNNLFN